MAKPRSFRCRALFSLALAPKCERHGMGKAEGARCWGPLEAGFGAAWAVPPRWGPDLQAGTCARGSGQTSRPQVGSRVLGFREGPPRTGSRILERVGWGWGGVGGQAGGDFS